VFNIANILQAKTPSGIQQDSNESKSTNI
jgi:hypothetical protein